MSCLNEKRKKVKKINNNNPVNHKVSNRSQNVTERLKIKIKFPLDINTVGSVKKNVFLSSYLSPIL